MALGCKASTADHFIDPRGCAPSKSMHAGGEFQELADVHIRVERIRFRKVTYPAADLQGLFGHIVPANRCRATSRRQITGNNLHGGRLSRPVRAQESNDLTLLQAETDTVHRFLLPVLFQQGRYID